MPHDLVGNPNSALAALPTQAERRSVRPAPKANDDALYFQTVAQKGNERMAVGHNSMPTAEAERQASMSRSSPHLGGFSQPTMSEYPAIDGAYRLIRLIGKGNFAEVHLAQHLVTGILVAVKIISKKQCKNHQLVCVHSFSTCTCAMFLSWSASRHFLPITAFSVSLPRTRTVHFAQNYRLF
jgi:hypothetical protein